MQEDMIEQKCPIWGTEAEIIDGEWIKICSPYAGGEFYLTNEARRDILDQGGVEKCANLDAVKISTHILKQNIKNIVPKFTYHQLENISQEADLNVTERFNLLLKTMKWRDPEVGQDIEWRKKAEYYAATGCNDPKGAEVIGGILEGQSMLRTFLKEAQNRGCIDYYGDDFNTSINVYLTLYGHQYIESLGHQLSDSDQIFVAMWFNKQTQPLFENAIKPAIKDAGYKEMRIDDKPHNEKICDEIIAEIRKSKALISDMTCGLAKPESWSAENLVGAPRGGVFYEAGFAHGLGIPVIWTVNQDIADIENVSHFDVRQFNQIRWTKDNLEEAKKKIQHRIEATLGQGPHMQ